MCATMLAWSATAGAQAAVNPRTVSFIPSPDHGAIDSNGQSIVTSYELEIYEATAAQPLRVLVLGKPAPASDGTISLDFVTLLASPLPTGVSFVARVAAVGPGGRAVSAASNVFVFESAAPTPCSTSAQPTSMQFPAYGGTATVAVSAATGCAWQSRTTASWITIVSGADGTGNATLAIQVSANQTALPRDDVVWVGPQAVSVSQALGPAHPGLLITTPSDGAHLQAPARLAIVAKLVASGIRTSGAVGSRDRTPSNDRAISRIAFYVNGRLVGTATAAPFRIAWAVGAPGTFQIFAIATDNRGVQVWSKPITLTVAGTPPTKRAVPRKKKLPSSTTLSDRCLRAVSVRGELVEPICSSFDRLRTNGQRNLTK